MPSDDIAIAARNLSKRYRLFGHPGDRIKQFMSLGLRRYHREFTALQDVSFDIRRGETVGIIGRNGAGKSTLLQLVCGILKPTTGTVKVNGRISALLELGAGFNPEFTGRENVYFQGALMGFTKAQMDARFDEIAAFADIGEFIDQPVRTYSSGMFVRLAFSAALALEPDILVADEVLGVGDVEFQKKCFARLAALKARGGTILLVSHALEQVGLHCSSALLLENGTLVLAAGTEAVLQRYLQSAPAVHGRTAGIGAEAGGTDLLSRRPGYNRGEKRWGDRAASILDACIVQNGIENPLLLWPGVRCEVRLWCEFHANIDRPVFGLVIRSCTGTPVFATNSRILLGAGTPSAGRQGERLCVRFAFNPLFEEGEYLISFGLASETGTGLSPHDRRYDVLRMRLGRAGEQEAAYAPSCDIEPT